MDAIYIFTENGRTQYAYSKYGGNYATPLVRLSEASFASFEHECHTLDAIMELNYDGEYTPQERNGNKVFNRLDDTKMTNDTAYMLMRSGVVGSVINVDLDRSIIRYSFNSTFGKQNYVLDIMEANNALQDAFEMEGSKPKITAISANLEPSFEIIQHQGKSKDYVMDIVVIEPDTPAYAKRLDISDGKLRAMQSVVQGYLEPLRDIEEEGMYVYGNDEARVLKQSPNRRTEGQAICGTFFICGCDENTNSVSLTSDQMHKYIEKYKTPDRFSEQEIEAAHRCEMYFFTISEMSYPGPSQQAQKQTAQQTRSVKL